MDFEMNGTVLKKYHGAGGAVVVPDSVTEIYICAFCGRSDITSITFPDTLVTIGERAFMGCRGLTSLELPASLRVIGREAFAGCTGLRSVCVPRSVYELGFYAFHDCTSLTHIEAPAATLGDWPFPRCVESAVLLGAACLSKGAFADFIHLRSVTFRGSVQIIEKEAFARCRALEEVVLPEGVTDIQAKAFLGCTSLTSVSIPASTIKIRENAFVGCEGLASCTFADTARWCRLRDGCIWPPYNDVEGEDIDLADPQANASIVTDLDDMMLFKKRSAPRPEPASPRFLIPVSERAEDGLFVQGQYFAYITPDEATKVALWEQACHLSLARTEVTEHDHDEYGRYTDVETRYYPLTEYRALCAPYSSSNADIIVVDGKLVGVVLGRVFCGTRNGYDDCYLDLPNSPEEYGRHLIILWADGCVVGENQTTYSDHSGRDFTDSSTEYKLVTAEGKETERHMWWS